MKKVWLREEACYTFIHTVYEVYFHRKIKTINHSGDMEKVSATGQLLHSQTRKEMAKQTHR